MCISGYTKETRRVLKKQPHEVRSKLHFRRVSLSVCVSYSLCSCRRFRVICEAMHITCSPACGHRGYMKAIPRNSVAAVRFLRYGSTQPAQRWCLQRVGAVAGADGATLATEASEATDRVSQAYPFTEIESKWQAYWEEQQTFRTPDKVDTSKPKYYVLDMFPYPRCDLPNISGSSRYARVTMLTSATDSRHQPASSHMGCLHTADPENTAQYKSRCTTMAHAGRIGAWLETGVWLQRTSRGAHDISMLKRALRSLCRSGQGDASHQPCLVRPLSRDTARA